MANEKPIHAGLIAALTGKLRQTADIWFGPSAPPLQVAPATNPVRSFDYPVGVNVQFAPRSDEPVTFEQMRNLADHYYLLRIVIETVKDRICAKPWQFRVRADGCGRPVGTRERDANIEKLTQFFRMPDREHTWQSGCGLCLKTCW